LGQIKLSRALGDVLAFGHGNENAKLLKGHAGNPSPSPKPPLIPSKCDLTIEDNLSLSAAALSPGRPRLRRV
jgi:hypothetical protein